MRAVQEARVTDSAQNQLASAPRTTARLADSDAHHAAAPFSRTVAHTLRLSTPEHVPPSAFFFVFLFSSNTCYAKMPTQQHTRTDENHIASSLFSFSETKFLPCFLLFFLSSLTRKKKCQVSRQGVARHPSERHASRHSTAIMTERVVCSLFTKPEPARFLLTRAWCCTIVLGNHRIFGEGECFDCFLPQLRGCHVKGCRGVFNIFCLQGGITVIIIV